MGSSWNVLRLFCIYFILNIQYSFDEASPIHGLFVTEATPEQEEKLAFVVSLNNKQKLKNCKSSNLAAEEAHFCGGSLITSEHVLTAAHCLTPWKRFDEVVVKIGSIDLRRKAHVRDVSWWMTYSQFHNKQFPDNNGTDIADIVFDIAVLKLNEPVTGIQPPTISYIPNEGLYEKSVVIAGWGKIEENERPRILRLGTTETEGSNCEIYDLYNGTRGEFGETAIFCSRASFARAATGDSGSPVLYDEKNPDCPNNIIGVHKSGTQDHNIHTSVYFFKSFIETVTQLEVT